MKFKHLGTFALLAVCLFAIVIVMGGCGGDEDDPPGTTGTTGTTETTETTEKTFKEQLVEGSWRTVSNADGERMDSIAKTAAALFSQLFGEPMTGKLSQNSLRFENSGKVTQTYGIELATVANPADILELVYTFKGSFWIIEDEGSSAIMTMSLTEQKISVVHDDADVAAIWQDIIDAEDPGDAPGDVLDEERAAINGDQLRLGGLVAERAN